MVLLKQLRILVRIVLLSVQPKDLASRCGTSGQASLCSTRDSSGFLLLAGPRGPTSPEPPGRRPVVEHGAPPARPLSSRTPPVGAHRGSRTPLVGSMAGDGAGWVDGPHRPTWHAEISTSAAWGKLRTRCERRASGLGGSLLFMFRPNRCSRVSFWHTCWATPELWKRECLRHSARLLSSWRTKGSPQRPELRKGRDNLGHSAERGSATSRYAQRSDTLGGLDYA